MHNETGNPSPKGKGAFTTQYTITVESAAPKFAVDVVEKRFTKTLSGLRPEPRLTRIITTLYANTQEELDRILEHQPANWDEFKRECVVRTPNARDLATVRFEAIQNALEQAATDILQAEDKTLAYDYWEFGTPDLHLGIGEAIQEAVDQVINPEDNDPVSNGWVGANGLP